MKSKILKILLLIIIVIIILAGLYLFKKKNTKALSTTTYNYYNYWKKKYIIDVSSNTSRVIDPENNNITVSEGMGYGLIFSVTANDQDQFEKLWNYTKNYLDENGLMNWKIDQTGNIQGKGSATDADEDIAYALLLASKKWPKTDYLSDASKMISAIKNHEISKDYILLPGDKWGGKVPFNPSYFSPYYYLNFASLSTSESGYWEKVLNTNLELMEKNSNSKTGLLPDWLNKDGTVDDKNNNFGYDAVRVPLRLIEFYKKTNNAKVKDILKRENNFFANIGTNNLVAGYSVDGKPLTNYINSTYLSAYAAASLVDEGSTFNKQITAKLKNAKDTSYYSCSLKMWTLFIIEGELAK
ncbi:glycosyl hydrolase family 8 [Clostridium hydrogenum]|uniref:glycosyl hydrolase family 8 n=1 Tax=Clostridium hydrogenum TaxID=2855764 RepID=UPI001F34121A|nr:glycosyl hydrolase family 8 [Clostridium hydrogenum]